ncbi:glycosyltransferase family 4 protein [Vibrio mimicus]|uniref:Glycosyl transferase n=1 Tax=Vibrio mimicus TaxID=674 RepID=A0A2J9UX95_VIBMI|nr:glycosyltransferase family 4 protein [Vibrio mimicus]EEW11430.1 glycosyltransferase [Vibrio mimicus VM573]KFE32396.1 glycosyl transferases group 1 family protein [Vibrio mimicus]PNM56125.1 glycosyl transferase [Vibrio mimicus]
MKPATLNSLPPCAALEHRLWLLIDSRVFGGIESHVLQLAQGLQQHQQSVVVVILRRYQSDTPLLQKLSETDVPFCILADAVPQRSLNQALLAALRHYQPHLVHAHGYKASLLSRLAVKRSGLPIRQFTTYHAGETPVGRVKLYDWCDRYTAFLSHHSFSVSIDIARKVPFHTTRLNNFVDTDKLTFKHGKQIAFVGRLSPEKGPERMITIATSLPDTMFDVYGDGVCYTDLVAQSPNNIRWHGHQTHMHTVWPNIGVLILCSRAEGLPLAALEAMAQGILVIASPVGELPTLIQHGVNGFLADSEQAFCDVLQHWQTLPQTKQQALRLAARESVLAHYSSSAVIPQLLTHYQKPI